MADAHVLNAEMGLALNALQDALKVNPASPEAQRAIGRLYVMRKDYKNGEAFFRKMIAATPRISRRGLVSGTSSPPPKSSAGRSRSTPRSNESGRRGLGVREIGELYMAQANRSGPPRNWSRP